MAENIYFLIGGIGMFLVGMEIMTNALKSVAGSNLRGILTRFTTTPLRGVLTGALSTIAVQSSSATTVMTVGFVGAGLMTMSQALGVIYGANIGTTVIGWLVAILGFKLKLGTAAMVALFPASLAGLLARGALARAGRVLSGSCLLLIGLDLMQNGMGDLTRDITPDMLPGDGIGGLLAIAGIGAGLTILMQASTAALALALVMLAAGAINLTQAACIVIGMNIGTTFTAVLASLGGSTSMRQTALANLIFNVVTSAIAFPLLLLVQSPLRNLAAATDEMTALLVFHSGFNLVGTILFLPVTDRFAALVGRLLPEREPERLVTLDKRLLSDAGSAILAAQSASGAISGRVFRALAAALATEPDYRPLAALEPCEQGLIDLREFLSDIRLSPDREEEEIAYSALLHQADHLGRLLGRAHQTKRMETLLGDRMLRRPGLATGTLLSRVEQDIGAPENVERLARMQRLVRKRRLRHRRALLLGEHAGLYSLDEVFAYTDAMRWLDRTLHHAERLAHYHHVTADELPAADKRPAAG
ncbi:Na/Pi cotransporter family protein [Primorskyibacter sp. S87]|uniref:Na/Pi cotransporter family protein n=1 Tax=Primorskyibacter sp. S87 TaxID=3415126 RepID=UPI003C7EB2C9